ncbi:MAG: recombination regulator RecX [Limnohabitans sp.]
MPKPALQPSLKGRALRLLSQREHSRLELERKLAEHETEPGQLAKALDALQAKGFISEERVIESVIHRRAGKLGTTRVRQELAAKGLSGEVVAEALEQLRGTELERAREVWRRKFGEPATDPKDKARQIRFLVSRGFAAEVVRKVVQGAEEN